MTQYTFLITPWPVANRWNLCDPLKQTLELTLPGISFKGALQYLLKSLEFDKYFRFHTSVCVYGKSDNGKLYSIPQYEDIELQ